MTGSELAPWLAPWLAPLLGMLEMAAPRGGAAVCPGDMALVEGVHHEQAQRLCTDTRMGDKCFAFLPGFVTLEPRRTPVRACVDRYEWPNRRGALPEVMMRFTEAEALCASVGKRLCGEHEWELACEGPQHLPWPYGWHKRDGACLSDKPYRPYDGAKLHSDDAEARRQETRRLWQGAPSGSFPECISAAGVLDLVGSVEEWVTTFRPQWPHRSSLKGGYWSKPWSGCRGTNERHGPEFRFYEIGFRCCMDPKEHKSAVHEMRPFG